jgi:phosphatidylglycerophosphate synthase
MSDSNRRPLKSRGTKWAAALTRWLAATSVTPNQISMTSILMGALAGGAFWLSADADGWARALLLAAAALFMQLRLLCNLLDGMVAIEAGKSTADGAFWNEFPDRIADIFILVGAGFAVGQPEIGWAAAAFAVLTAYVREHGRACGAPADYSGPMAKQQRMAVLTLGALAAASEPLWNTKPFVLKVALWAVVIGAALTALRRSVRLVKHLHAVAR